MIFSLLAILAGGTIALQASINAQLGSILKSPLLATAVVLLVSACSTMSAFSVSDNALPEMQILKTTPWYLWITGGVLSAIGISLCYFLIPKMGIGNMMAYYLSGQIVVAMVIAHFGWFGSNHTPVTWLKAVGVIAIICGVILVNLSQKTTV
ncbi:DMT family transporter (plasmid) [Pseudoalteromonas sp. T1lg65]|uniref:DMT family transporter n=1 Tax=Pseudoalteromonas sp. T1lg65 TaxID=2077101 RepID=UPI003F7AA999